MILRAIEDFEIRVLALLGADEVTIPFQTINLPEYRGRGEARAAIKTDIEDQIDTLSVYETAILLLPYYKMQVMKTEQSPHGKIERFEIDWIGLETFLKNTIEEIVAESNPGPAPKPMNWFCVTNREGYF